MCLMTEASNSESASMPFQLCIYSIIEKYIIKSKTGHTRTHTHTHTQTGHTHRPDTHAHTHTLTLSHTHMLVFMVYGDSP